MQTYNTNIQKRIKRIIGQLEGINRMIEEKRDCSAITQQIIAARSALSSLGIEVIVNDKTICQNNSANNIDTIQKQKTVSDLLKSLFKLT